MAFDTNHLIDLPPISVKLSFTMRSGGQYEGTGFCVEHQGRIWLVTCRHNVEDREYDFTGANDLISMSLGGGSVLAFDATRSVVAISVDGFVPDCAAIELRPGEWGDTPRFSTATAMWTKNVKLPDTINVQAPPPSTQAAKLQPTGWVLFQGFPGGAMTPTTLRGVRVVPLPWRIRSWMPTFLPACVEGFSGGPVLDMTDETMTLLGITTHRFPAQFQVNVDEGRRAEVQIEASIAAPLAPLLWALERAPPGVSVIPVRSAQVGAGSANPRPAAP
ncbi:hypothetical protein PMI01_03862 [Caulobacter sp. AP07]|uniref:trypsin-like peptidase domain-containing protein n=1 Tax=Caulobacter sp. AP07 TaxID=1144304 RepID=UPI000272118B|nr:trypsin-like peptidase domain-containing protein [Caulobacter sp. AP07]EJL27381.1 hypothetical protein PMI01_03862 [Caulobacter sp. AP07]